MKKLILYVLLLWNGLAFGQSCTPDPSIIDTTGSLVFMPDTMIGFPNCPMNVIVTILAPDSLSIFPHGLTTFDHMKYNTITKPAWINLICGDTSCEYYSGFPGCMTFFGTPPVSASNQTFTINILVDLYSHDTSVSQPVIVDTNIGLTLILIVLFPCDIDVYEQNQSEFELYPNPTNDFFNIKSKDSFEKIEIMDVTGRTILTTTMTRISMNNLSNGIYFLRLTTITGQIGIRKIIKQ